MNIYYEPEHFGLTMIGAFEWAEPCWQFDTLAVWKSRRGQYWIGQDSGCSCPMPFENITSVDQLDGPYNKGELRKRLNSLVNEKVGEGDAYHYPKATLMKSVADLLARI